MNQQQTDPLAGIRIVELGGIGPLPFACMPLSDLGVDIIRIERASGYEGGDAMAPRFEVLNCGRCSITLDLKTPQVVKAVLQLVANADALNESYRPGVAERLGLSPEQCHAVDPQLVYGRMTTVTCKALPPEPRYSSRSRKGPAT